MLKIVKTSCFPKAYHLQGTPEGNYAQVFFETYDEALAEKNRIEQGLKLVVERGFDNWSERLSVSKFFAQGR